MAKHTQRIKIFNDRSTFAVLYLEPWGEDYGLLPGDEIEIIAKDAEETFYFQISYTDQDILVWAEGDVNIYPYVYQKGEQIYCGHNRARILNR